MKHYASESRSLLSHRDASCERLGPDVSCYPACGAAFPTHVLQLEVHLVCLRRPRSSRYDRLLGVGAIMEPVASET
jgi:hypothetical protein